MSEILTQFTLEEVLPITHSLQFYSLIYLKVRKKESKKGKRQ